MCPRCMHQPYEKCNGVMRVFCYQHGGVAEWLNAAVLKTVRLERVSGVRIPPPPPLNPKQLWSQRDCTSHLSERLRRQPFPASIAPTLVAMRPDAPPDPAVETLEGLSDVGAFVILDPPSQERV